jgi:hypothetical protein
VLHSPAQVLSHHHACSRPAGSGRTSPAKPALPPASNPTTSLKSNSGESSPLGRFGAIGSGMTGLGPAGEDALAAKMGALSTADGAPHPEPQLPAGWAKVGSLGPGLTWLMCK